MAVFYRNMGRLPALAERGPGGRRPVRLGYFLDAWTQHPDAIPADIRAAYLRASDEATTPPTAKRATGS